MPRKLLLRNNVLPYHITLRANNRETFHLPLEIVWAQLVDECLFIQLIYDVEFHALVLMPNHLHLICTVPEHDLGVVMNELVKSVARRMNLRSGRSGHVFGGSYHWSIIQSARYFGHALKYVYRNPVRAQICKRVEDYPFSSMSGLLGNAHAPFPMHFTRAGMEIALPSDDLIQQLSWLNTPFSTEVETLIQKGLRGKKFSSILDRKTRRPIQVLEYLV